MQILPDWSDELYPLYAYHPSRHHPPAKVRAFLDFIQDTAKEEISVDDAKLAKSSGIDQNERPVG